MSKLEQLIKELCPNGVEYKSLKECTEMTRGTSTTKNKLTFGDIPVISGGKEPSFYCDTYNRTGETITIAGSGAGAGYVQYWNIPIFVNDAFSIKAVEELDTRYLYHYLLNIQDEIYATKKGGGVPHVYVSSIENFKIPLPPQAVQREIVRILDTFSEYITELTKELTEELTMRKKQYEYYRDSLLTFGDEVEWKTLGEVLKIKNGKDYKSFNKGNIPVYGSGGIIAYINTYAYNKPSVLIPRKGSIDKLYYVDKPFWTVDTIFYTEIFTDIIISKYIFYYLQREQLSQYNIAGGVPSLTQTILNKIKIPLPSLEEQQRIVDILDRFDTLYNDISKGLPGEIEARQKQYKYYRDKLLTFKNIND